MCSSSWRCARTVLERRRRLVRRKAIKGRNSALGQKQSPIPVPAPKVARIDRRYAATPQRNALPDRVAGGMRTIVLKAELPILVVAGILAQKLAAKLWRGIFKRQVPDTAQEHVRVAELIPAAVLEGAFYKLARMAIDRGLRVAAARSEGVWIGKAGEGE